MLVTSKSARDLAMGENEPCRSPLAITCDSSGYTNIMAVRVVEFSKGGTKVKRFLPKNQHTQKKSLNFEKWVNGEVSKYQNFIIY